MAYSRVFLAMMFAFLVGSALAQAPEAATAASLKMSPAPVASPPKSVATPTSAPVASPTLAPTVSSPIESPQSSPPAPPAADTPASSPAGSIANPPSIDAAPSGLAPGSSPNVVTLNKVTVAGSAAVAFFAASLLF